jgi:hypothetical protein
MAKSFRGGIARSFAKSLRLGLELFLAGLIREIRAVSVDVRFTRGLRKLQAPDTRTSGCSEPHPPPAPFKEQC